MRLNILETIIASKRKEVEERRSYLPATLLESHPLFTRRTFSLVESLEREGSTGIIAEFKRRSPSKGAINEEADVARVTRGYAEGGAAGLSVLTDQDFFGGSTDDLMQARDNVLPILRKDFIIDEYQLIEARAMGADVILLIAAALSPRQTQTLARMAKDLGLEVLLELHEEEELDHYSEQIDLVGINNRSLKSFEVEIERSLLLAEKLPAQTVRVAESGISSIENIELFRQNGYRGFLIGEHFMKEADPVLAFARFMQQLKTRVV